MIPFILALLLSTSEADCPEYPPQLCTQEYREIKMPFKSESQRRFMWMKHPEIAKKWSHEYPESNKGLPSHVGKELKKRFKGKGK